MANQLEGRLDAGGRRFAVVASRFNGLVVEQMLQGALATLRRHGAAEEAITVVHVPGSFEIPLAVERLARSGRFDGIVALGAVIKGETSHFDYVAAESAAGLSRATLDTGVPVGFGILTCDTLEQAMNRAGGKSGNKGCDAALAAIEMADLLARLGQG